MLQVDFHRNLQEDTRCKIREHALPFFLRKKKKKMRGQKTSSLSPNIYISHYHVWDYFVIRSNREAITISVLVFPLFTQEMFHSNSSPKRKTVNRANFSTPQNESQRLDKFQTSPRHSSRRNASPNFRCETNDTKRI